jgi:hypothetical protein
MTASDAACVHAGASAGRSRTLWLCRWDSRYLAESFSGVVWPFGLPSGDRLRVELFYHWTGHLERWQARIYP